ncbi:TonB-dependent receptor [Sphingomonas sp. SM33]|uniref:TonB-dependent receptor n=1 Tax=Sphingomonas telluris TaxID=2907998 RepID=A0ABS9VID4_9SPHN|nr:TonB-dependent receptor [Sphingomonas telluris]MCH8614720.1 TonB-dependent receptor [Sphingomonas telluris]
MTRLGSRITLFASAAFISTVASTAASAQDAQPSTSEAVVSQGTETAQSTADQQNASGGEIVVTAQKRVEALSDVAQSVSVVGGDTLERQQADNLQDYLALVPGLSLTGETRGVSRISLRGINTGGVASTVGVYVDEVPFGSSSGLANGAILAGDFDTFDVARIEVLRGPQGTLYGASSLGGVLKFVTNAPNPNKFEARAQVSLEDVAHGGLGYSGTGMVNVPLNDKIAFRASGFYRKDAGYIDSIGNNPVTSLIDPADVIIPGSRVDKNINELKSYGGRASLLFNATDDLSIRLSALVQNTNSDNSDYVEVDPVTLDQRYGGLVQSRYLNEPTKIKYRVYSGVLDYDFGFANLTSSTSYGKFSENLHRDLTLNTGLTGPGTPLGPLVDLLYGTGDPRLSALLEQVTSTKKFVQELRLASPDNDKFEWLVGAFYTNEDSGINPQNYVAVDAISGEPMSSIPLLVEGFLNSKFKEYAAFANGTLHVTPKFDLTLGGRWSHNKQSAEQFFTGDLLGGAVIEFSGLKSDESVFTYSVAPRYEITENTSVYARVASGYRPGGPNVLQPGADAPATYDSDRLISYEAGLKADWFNRRLSLDFSAFYLDWKDIQLFAVINDFGVNANGGTAVSKGFEFTLTGRPIAGLSLSLNGAYTDAHLTKKTDPLIGGLKGDPLPYIPDWSFGFNADYEWPITDTLNAFVGTSISYVSDRTPDFGDRAPDGELLHLDSYETFDLRAGVETGRWIVQAYVRNLFDSQGITSVTSIDPGTFANDAGAIGIIRPRTVGLSVGTRF